jgi:hypothetical protein
LTNCINPPVLTDNCNNNACQADEWSCKDWGKCQSDSKQYRECKLVFDCSTVDNEKSKPPFSQDCKYIEPVVSVDTGTANNSNEVTPIDMPSVKKEEVVTTATSDNLNKECIDMGIKNALTCNTYLAQMNIVKECTSLDYKTKDRCKAYLLEKYGMPIKCNQFYDNLSKEEAVSKCNTLINSVILSEFDNMINEATVTDLENSTGKQVVVSTSSGTIKTTDSNNQEKEIKMSLPLSEKNGELKASLVSIKKTESSTVQSPVAIIFDEDGNGIPDELDKRLKELNITKDKLTGVDKAIVDKKSIEQPKNSENISAALNVEMENNEENNTLTFKGKTYPNQVITLFIYSSVPIMVTIKADENGNWIYDLDKGLSNGKHEVYVAINDSEGKLLEASVPKLFFIAEARAVGLDDYLGGIQPAATSTFVEKSDSMIRNYIIGGGVIILLLIVTFLLIKKIATNKYE